MKQSLSVLTRQLQILILLYRFRFLTRIHIQSLLNHKNHRRIQAWLTDLVDGEYIGRIYTREFGVNNKPAVYFLKPKVRRVLKGQDSVNEDLLERRVYREKLRSQRFIEHSLFLADVYLYLKSLAEENKEQLHFYTSTDLIAFGYLPLPLPDAYIALKKGKVTRRYFLDILDENMPRFAMRKKIIRYFAYYDTDLWTKHTNDPFPKILIICPSEAIRKHLNKFIIQTLEEEMAEIDFYLGTKEKIQKKEKDIWQKIITYQDEN